MLKRDGELKLPPPRPVPEVDEPAAPAWQGFRSFRVERKVFEDALQAVCSFHIVPEDGQPLPAFLPGQFLTFRFDVPTANGSTEQIIRCYALGQVARRYYAGGRQMNSGLLRESFQNLLEPAKQLQAQYLPQMQQRAGSLDVGQIMAMVRGT